MKAFYFSTEEETLRFGDNRKISVGTTHTVSGAIKLCKNGLHASVKPLDAAYYAPGPILWLVELEGAMDIGDDKVAAESRTYLARFDATEILREFARKQALINIDKIKPYCTAEQYKVIMLWLTTGREEYKLAAYSAARSAAWAADSAANSDTWLAEEAAYSAANSAANSAARSAAYSATGSAAWAAHSAAEAAKSASRLAEEAAYSAARSAARSASNEMLLQMIKEATGWDV